MEISVDLRDYSNDERAKILNRFEDVGWVRSAMSFEKLAAYTNDEDVKHVTFFIYRFTHTSPNPVVPDGVKYQIIR